MFLNFNMYINKTIQAGRTLVLLVWMAVFAFGQGAIAQQASLELVPSQSTITVGEPVTITVQLTLNEAVDLNSVGFNLQYNADQFDLVNNAELPLDGDPAGLNFALLDQVSENGSTGIYRAALANTNFGSVNNQSGTIELAQFVLEGIAANGTPDITFELIESESVVVQAGGSVINTDFVGTSIAVTNAAPPNQQPQASFTAAPTSGIAPVQVDFDASGSNDPDGTIVSYDWDFGDGNTGNGVSPSHTYLAAGNYTVTLTVTDDDGDSDTETENISITAEQVNTPPSLDPVSDVTQTVGTNITLNFTASDPDENDNLNFFFLLENENGNPVSNSNYTFTDNGDGTASFSWNTAQVASGTYDAELTVTDGEAPATTFFSIILEEAVVTPDPEVMVGYDPKEQEVFEGEAFSVTVTLQPNAPVGITSAGLLLSFDPTKLQVDEAGTAPTAEAAAFFPLGFSELLIDNEAGTIEIAGLSLEEQDLSADLPMLDIAFVAQDMAGETTLTFFEDGAKKTLLTPLGVGEIPIMLMDGTVTIVDVPDCDQVGPILSVADLNNPTTCGGNGSIILSLTKVPDGQYTITYDGGAFQNVPVTNGTATITAPAGSYPNLQIMVDMCTSTTGVNATLNDPNKPTLALTDQTNPAVCGEQGSFELTATGVPNGPAMVGFDGGSFDVVFNGGVATVAAPAGSYDNLTITVNGCTSMEDVDVDLPDPGTPTIGVVEIIAATNCDNPLGGVVLTGLNPGANSLATYFFNGQPVGIQIQADQNGQAALNNLPAGNYTDFSISAGNCVSNELAFNIPFPQDPVITTGLVIQPSGGQANGSITISNLLPDTDYTLEYAVNGMDEQPLSIESDGNGAYTLENLAPGSYALSVIRSGCFSNTLNVMLMDPSIQPEANLAISPGATTANIGETFTLDVILQPVNEPMISAIAAYLDYDDSAFEVTDLEPKATNLFTFPLTDDISTPGQVDYAAGTVNPVGHSQPITLFTLTCTALQPVNLSEVSFAFSTDNMTIRLTTVTDISGNNILGTTNNATVTVQDVAALAGQIDLQYLSDNSADDLTLYLYEPGTSNLVSSYDIESDGSGSFSLADLIPGTYDVYIKKTNYLSSRVANLNLAGGSVTPVVFPLLRAGDADGDDQVTLQDYNLFAAAFGTIEGNAQYNPLADFINIGNIFIEDFTAWSNNFGNSGALFLLGL